LATKKGGLGKGLEALFADNTQETAIPSRMLKLSEIEPNKDQPRKDFDQEALMELADSIRQHGVIQPLIVRPMEQTGYQLVAGERRWRAARMAGLTEVPAIIKDISGSQAMEIALIENLQREDLNPIEEAEGYRALMEEHGFTQDQVAGSVGRSRPLIANAVRLLQLPEKVIAMVKKGDLSAGHARTLLALEDKSLIEKIAVEIVKHKMSVRELEKYVKSLGKTEKKPLVRARDAYYSEIELALKGELGRKITVKEKKGKGCIEIEFYNKEDLADIARRLAGEL